MIPDPSGQLTELIVYITSTRVDLYSQKSYWLDLVNSFVYYAWQTREIYHALTYSMDFKAPGEL